MIWRRLAIAKEVSKIDSLLKRTEELSLREVPQDNKLRSANGWRENK